MYSLYKRILSSSNVIINAITDSFTFISTLYEEWLNYFKFICLCIPIPCLCFYVLSVYFVVCSMDLCLTIKHYYYNEISFIHNAFWLNILLQATSSAQILF